MADSPEFLALLAKVRAERDAANDSTARTSDENRAQWLGTVEGNLASKRTPDEQGAPYGDALLEVTEDDLRLILGRLPWVRETHMGTVLSVDRATQTCRVRIGTDALNPSAVPFQRPISYGLVPPTVGKTYPVHFPVVPPRTPATLTAGPQTDPEHLPWLKVPGGLERWLYYHPVETTPFIATLRRIHWPVTAESVPEDVAHIPLAAVLGTGPSDQSRLWLRDYHTGTRTLFLGHEVWDSFAPDDYISDYRTFLTKIDDWGFGTITSTTTTPERVLIGPVAENATDDPAAVIILGIEAVPEHFDAAAFYVGNVDPLGPVPVTGIGVYTSTHVRVSPDGGVTWNTVHTEESAHPIPESIFTPAADGFASPDHWPLHFATVMISGPPWITGGPFSGMHSATLRADSALGSAGTAIIFVPAYFASPFVERDWADPDNRFSYAVWTWTADSGYLQLGTVNLPGQTYIFPPPLFIRQAEDGSLVCYGLFDVGPPFFVFPFFHSHHFLYRGEGTVAGDFTWTQISTDLDTSASLTDPAQILAVSDDGESLVAFSAGFDDDGWQHRLVSDDRGATWAPIALPALLRDIDQQTLLDFLFVDIPVDDPRAAPVEA